jgi:hypothetical protein
MWVILTNKDIKDIISFRDNAKTNVIYNTLVSGNIADECFIGVMLMISNKMNKVLNITTTILDWEQNNAVSSHPYVFSSYNEYNRKLLHQKRKQNENGLFLRKISSEFPDDVLQTFIA